MAPAILAPRPRILYLDAYDSFSNNIVAQVQECLDAEVHSIRIDDPSFQKGSTFEEYLRGFDAAIAGPGPGWATSEEDVGLINRLWKLENEDLLPVLGICLGFQSLCLAFGADIEKLAEPKHGLISEILHRGRSIFDDVGELFATQYHSLQANIGHPIQTTRSVRYPAELWKATEKCPELEPLAWDFDNKRNGAVLMSVKHTAKPFYGVQFHPESICTNNEGIHVIQNWWKEAQLYGRKRLAKHTGRTSSLSTPGFAPLARKASRLKQTTCASGEAQELDGELAGDLTEIDYSPAGLARLISHGDLTTLPHFPPKKVHCSTTGSGRLTVHDVCELLNIPHNEAIVLESGLQANLLPMKVGTGRYSIVGMIIPGETVRLHHYTSTGVLQLRNGNDEVYLETHVDDPWSYIRAIMEHLRPVQAPSGPTFAPFWGGLMGFASYEAGLQTIDVDIAAEPKEQSASIPDVCFAYITRSIVFDHQVKKIYVQSIRGADDRAWVMQTLDQIYDAVGQKSQSTTPNSTPTAKDDPFETDAVLNDYLATCEATSMSGESYKEIIASCQDLIKEGHSYELCLTNQNKIKAQRPEVCKYSTADNNELSWKLYRRLTERNPAPFSAYLRLHNVHVLSSSPERFISWDRNQSAQCRPIKGTVQKGPGVTAADADAILSSSKERAENLMIVDLVRHQLHGVYGSGNVHVSQLMEVEEYETLWQLVSVVDAVAPGAQKPRTPDEWEDPVDYVSGKNADSEEDNKSLGFDAFVQSLPPGSMTGAPKKRSCEILQKAEDGERRGIYSGVLGYFDVGGGGDFSVVIRTAVKVDNASPEDNHETWNIGAGGAITSQSTPEGEYDEMRAKFASTSRAFRPRTECPSERPNENDLHNQHDQRQSIPVLDVGQLAAFVEANGFRFVIDDDEEDEAE